MGSTSGWFVAKQELRIKRARKASVFAHAAG